MKFKENNYKNIMRGGKREGAGRKPRPFKIKVKQVEIPELLHEKLKNVANLRQRTIEFWSKLVEEAEKKQLENGNKN